MHFAPHSPLRCAVLGHRDPGDWAARTPLEPNNPPSPSGQKSELDKAKSTILLTGRPPTLSVAPGLSLPPSFYSSLGMVAFQTSLLTKKSFQE
jgi:hypothetical protein